MTLLTTGNPKIIKGRRKGYLSFILHLAPATLSGYQACPRSSEGCRGACLNSAGRGGIFRKGETTNAIQQARIRKTVMFFEDRPSFMKQLVRETHAGIRLAARHDLTPCFRLNGTSDVRWELHGIIEEFPHVQFYDYTKIINRNIGHLPNYHLTFSRSESNALDVALAFSRGMNVAIVFRKPLPLAYMNRKVIDGTEHDLRFLDPPNVWVSLNAKGKGKKDTTGFVVSAV